MKSNLLNKSANVVGRFNAPLNPRILCWLHKHDVKIESETAEAICEVFDPGYLQKGHFRVSLIEQTYSHMNSHSR